MIIKTSSDQDGNADVRKHWAIVGGGMMGLTLAYRMAKMGQKITLFEAAPTLGGLAAVWDMNEIEWEKYYHVILLSDSRLRNLLKEIQLDEKLKWAETKTGFFTDGQLYSMSDTKEFMTFPPLKLIEKLRLGGTIFYASKIRNWKRLEKIGVVNWLRRWSGKGTFEKIWEPLLKAKLGECYKKTSAAFIWAAINRMYKARRTGLKKEMFGYVEGGYRTVLARLAELLEERGVEIKTGYRISDVAQNGDGTFSLDFAEGGTRQFDRVIMSTPCSVIDKVCHDLTTDEKQRFDDIEYLGIVCASMLIKKPISPYYVTNITDTWVPLTAVIEMSNIVDKSELGGSSLIYLPKYIPAEHPMFERTDEEIREEFLATLEKIYPEFDREDVQAFRVSRTRNVMALPVHNYSRKLPSMKTTVSGLYIVNSAYILKGNLNVNETITIAEEALNGVLADELKSTEKISKTVF